MGLVRWLYQANILVILVVAAFLVAAWLWARALFLRRIPILEKCPRCGGTEFHREHRNIFERFFLAGEVVRRYRCKTEGCDWVGLRYKRYDPPGRSDAGEISAQSL